jgi:uncharacterized protein (DUF4415 family)
MRKYGDRREVRLFPSFLPPASIVLTYVFTMVRVRHGVRVRRFMKKRNKKQKKQIAVIAAKKDEDIDLTDMPEVLDWSKAEIGKFYRPAKKPVTIRLDTDIIEWLKSYGRGYQTKTNMLLRHAMRSSVQAKANKRESA